jgi:hypothetical protein
LFGTEEEEVDGVTEVKEWDERGKRDGWVKEVRERG